MLHKLKLRYIFSSMGALFIVVLLLFVGINLFTTFQITQLNDHLLEVILENDGNVPKNTATSNTFNLFSFNEESPYSMRYFTINFENDRISDINLTHIATLSESDVKMMAIDILNQNENSGTYDDYQYLIEDNGSEKTLVALSTTSQQQTKKILLSATILVSLCSLIILLILVTLFSRRAIQPTIENINRQKQFITDAGHELKTPLAVISADVEVLELLHESNDWTTSIHHQITQMNDLIKQLITLSKMEETILTTDSFEVFDLSQLANTAVLNLLPLAQAHNKRIEENITPNLQFRGNPTQITQLFSILMENAIKYALPDTVIQVRLIQKRRALFWSVTNVCEKTNQEDLNHFFERFYRADAARTKSDPSKQGYGIGLSIAQAIVQNYKGKLTAELGKDQRSITFTVKL